MYIYGWLAELYPCQWPYVHVVATPVTMYIEQYWWLILQYISALVSTTSTNFWTHVHICLPRVRHLLSAPRCSSGTRHVLVARGRSHAPLRQTRMCSTTSLSFTHGTDHGLWNLGECVHWCWCCWVYICTVHCTDVILHCYRAFRYWGYYCLQVKRMLSLVYYLTMMITL